MKVLALAAALMFTVSSSFAHNHEKGKKKMGHDKEHAHVKDAKMDHDHDEAHHSEHDHKAHHPEHEDKKVEMKKKK